MLSDIRVQDPMKRPIAPKPGKPAPVAPRPARFRWKLQGFHGPTASRYNANFTKMPKDD